MHGSVFDLSKRGNKKEKETVQSSLNGLKFQISSYHFKIVFTSTTEGMYVRVKRPTGKGLRPTGLNYKNGKRLETSLRNNISNENDKKGFSNNQ